MREGAPLSLARSAVYTVSAAHTTTYVGREVHMSRARAFLKEVRSLMERIPDDLTLPQLEWALQETSLSLGSIIAARHATTQHKRPIPGRKHTEKSPPR
jgi:hypothetical protein